MNPLGVAPAEWAPRLGGSRRRLRDLGSAVEILVSVLALLAVLFCLRMVLTTLGAAGRALLRLPMGRRLERRPLLVAFVSALSFAVVASPIGHFAIQGLPRGTPALLAVLLIALSMLAWYLPRALEPPPSLEAARDLSRLSAAEAWITGRMKNPVDGVWARPAIALSLLAAPALVVMLLTGSPDLPSLLLYGVVLALGEGSLNAFEHANCHYQIFRGRHLEKRSARFIFRVLELHCQYVLPILCARIPKWYAVQHVVVHHAEDNGPEDTQSTLRYDRASFIDLALCAHRFALNGLFSVDLIAYLRRKCRRKALRSLVGGMLVFYGVLAVIAVHNWQLALALLAFRYAGCLTAAMGFFQEHGLVDTADPTNVYRNSLHFMSPSNSHGSLGDDVHIEHHLHQGRHWSSYARDAEAHRERYGEEVALAFRDGPECPKAYYQPLWRRDFLELAERFEVFGLPNATTEEVAELLRARTRPLGVARRSPGLERLDVALGTAAGHLLC